MITLSDYRSIFKIHQGKHVSVFRARRETDGRPVILKAGTPESIKRFEHEFEMTRFLGHVFGVVRVLENIKKGAIPVLVFENFGGTPLDRFLSLSVFSPEKRLSLAVRIARILSEIHSAGVVHRKISASNVILNPRTGLVKISNFCNSVRVRGDSIADFIMDIRSFGTVCHEMFMGASGTNVRPWKSCENAPIFKLGRMACENISNVVADLIHGDTYRNMGEIAKDLKQCLGHRIVSSGTRKISPTLGVWEPPVVLPGFSNSPETIRAFPISLSHDVRTSLNGVLGMADMLAGSELTEEQRGFAETILSSGQTLLRTIDKVSNLLKGQKDEIGVEDNLDGPPPKALNRAPKVLLVEDNLTNQKISRTILEKLGCETDLARNGRAALRMIRKNRYDIVFMDCQMPVMDGFEATRAIRESENGKTRLPIVAMTANAMKKDRRRCLNAGMDDHIPKPIRLDRIQNVLRRFCGLDAGNRSRVLKTLIANDDPAILSIIRKALRKAKPDAAVKSVSTGVEACTLIGSFLPDILVIDMNMPDTDSLALCRFLRKHERYGKIRIIPVTGFDKDSVWPEEIRALDIPEYIPKPPDEKTATRILMKVANEISDIRKISEILNNTPGNAISGKSEKKCRETVEEPVLNLGPICEAIGEDIDIIHEFLGIFLDDVPSEIGKLERAMRLGDIEMAGRFAHGIKGAAGDVGGIRLRRVALEIEHAAREKDVETCGEKVVQVRREFELLRDALEKQDWNVAGSQPARTVSAMIKP